MSPHARLSLRSTCRCASLVQSPVCCLSDLWPCALGSLWWRQTAAANSPEYSQTVSASYDWCRAGSKLDAISFRSWMKEIAIQTIHIEDFTILNHSFKTELIFWVGAVGCWTDIAGAKAAEPLRPQFLARLVFPLHPLPAWNTGWFVSGLCRI